MTNEEAKKFIHGLSYDLGTTGMEAYTTDDGYKLRMAMCVLKNESQPCEDCISREDTLKKFKNTYFDNETVIRCAELVLGGMPPVQPTRPKGEWIKLYKGDTNEHCSKCGFEARRKYNFCPDCGEEKILRRVKNDRIY